MTVKKKGWSLKTLVLFYKYLMRIGKLKVGGAAHKRMQYLQGRLISMKRGDGIR
tara:strand:+ start:837 stop:998 length:162 start_codon:yes stop_codon:yes gene_type:complete